jgi:RNA exonuclease 4
LKKIIDNKIIVGHSLLEDFKALDLNKDEFKCELRDIAEFSKFKRTYPKMGEKRKLKELAEHFLNARIQDGHHSSVIDARIALALYRNNK